MKIKTKQLDTQTRLKATAKRFGDIHNITKLKLKSELIDRLFIKQKRRKNQTSFL